jgi:hypothetical protein
MLILWFVSEANLIRCTIIIGVNVATRCTLPPPLPTIRREGRQDGYKHCTIYFARFTNYQPHFFSR